MLAINLDIGDIVLKDGGNVDLMRLSELSLETQSHSSFCCKILSRMIVLVPNKWRR
jgi:hypothetical protein